MSPETVSAALARIVDHAHRSGRPVPLEAGSKDQWLRALLDALPTPIYATDRDGFLTYYNEAAIRFAGRTPTIGVDRWCITQRLFEVDGTPMPLDHCPMAVAIRENRSVRGSEAVAELADGTRIPFMPYPTPIHDDHGNLVGAVNMLVDISAHKNAELKAAHLATHDALTGLRNRAAFTSRIGTLVAEAAPAPFAVMKLDVIGFRRINDAYGHAAGDEFLATLAQRLSEAAPGCMTARIGVDQFGLVIPTPSGRDALRSFGEALRKSIGAGPQSQVDIVVGCALFPDDAGDETTLLAHAASALDEAKRGPEAVAFFDADAALARRERLQLEAELARAVAEGRLMLHYQPQMERDGGPRGFEVLVRWSHPLRGTIAPGDFIPIAEENGDIVAISEWILAEACREAASWALPLQVSVNISPAHFRAGDLSRRVRAILDETGLDPGRLELEITEGVMVDDFDRTMSLLQDLRAIGVGIALDDFGTGYSSLSYLQAFPLTKLKIDRSFTANLGRMRQSAAIVRAVVQLGHALGLDVVAEGVEGREQLDFLLAEGCDLIQGYFTGRPAPIETYRFLTEPVAAEGLGLRSA